MQQPDAQQHRIAALSALAQHTEAGAPNKPATQAGDLPAVKPFPAQRLFGARRAVILVGLVVVLIAGGIATYLIASQLHPSSSTRNTAPATLTLHPSDAGVYCVSSMEWSPDGRQIAVFGADKSCLLQNTSPLSMGMYVGVFDAQSGHVQRILAISQALAGQGLNGIPEQIAWAPDGGTVAVSVSYAYSHATGNAAAVLLLFSVTAQVDTPPRIISATPPEASNTAPKQIVWDLHSGSAGPMVDAVLPAALSYTWTADGRIVADQALPADPSALTGRPASAGGFSLWQAGEVVPQALRDGHYVLNFGTEPAAVSYDSSPVLWSPDGRYVVFGETLGGPVAYAQPPAGGQTCNVLMQTIPCPARPLPSPDAAFAQVVGAVQQGDTLKTSDGTVLPDWSAAPVEWSADGKLLYTILPGDTTRKGDTTAKTVVTALDTATGEAIKQYSQDGGPTFGVSCQGASFHVSPTGQQLAISQCQADTITLWNTQER